MLKGEIKAGTHYAIREKRVPGTPLQHVRIIEHVRGNKWQAEWIEPNPGLVDYVESGHLIVRWKEHKAFLRDEARAEELQKHAHEHGGRHDSPVVRALEQIFESAGDGVQFNQGVLSGTPEAIERVKMRSGFDPAKRSPLGYVDRHGVAKLPFEEALELGRRVCAAEPSTVLVGVESTEREWSKDARDGEQYIIPLLNEYRASWALIRQWAGYDAAVAEREATIQRLERLVWDAIYALQAAHLDDEAAKLRRALQKKRETKGPRAAPEAQE